MKISPSECPGCGKTSLYIAKCWECGWRDEDFFKWTEEETERLRVAFEKYRSSTPKVIK